MRPVTVNLADHTKGDTWEGISSIGPVLINGSAPSSNASSCKIQFRKADSRDLGYELNNSPGTGEGTIVIDDAATWEFSVAAQALDMDAGNYVWDFEVTDAAGVVRTLYQGEFKYIQDIST